jgi:mannan endo-1,4-beta-mannosidase
MTPVTLSTFLATLSIAVSLASAAEFPKVDAASLKFDVGNATRYLRGTNAYWLPFQTNLEDIDTTLDHLAAGGLKVVRTWGFSDVNQIPPPGEYLFSRQQDDLLRFY